MHKNNQQPTENVNKWRESSLCFLVHFFAIVDSVSTRDKLSNYIGNRNRSKKASNKTTQTKEKSVPASVTSPNNSATPSTPPVAKTRTNWATQRIRRQKNQQNRRSKVQPHQAHPMEPRRAFVSAQWDEARRLLKIVCLIESAEIAEMIVVTLMMTTSEHRQENE